MHEHHHHHVPHPDKTAEGPGAGHVEHGTSGHAMHDPDVFRQRFWISLILTVPVLIYDPHIQEWFNFSPPAFPGSSQIPLVLGTVIFFYGGGVFLRGAWHEFRARVPGMMTLVALAITVAFGYSLATEVGLTGMPLYWELATLVTIMLLGHWIEGRAIGRAQGALKELARLLPDTAERITDGRIEEVPLSQIQPGDLLLIRPGSQVPADGEVVEGESSLNEAMITGESRPVRKRPGNTVIGGTVNEGGSLRVRVTSTGEESALGGIMRIVSQAQESRSRAQALADRAAYWLVLVAVSAGLVTFLVWALSDQPIEFAFERTVTVLVIACPHALGLAIPLVTAISTTLSARNGLLVRDRLALESARDIDTVVFDKTGTLTRGEMGVVNLAVDDGMPETQVLALAAAVEGDSEHMIATAIRAQAEEKGIEIPRVSRFKALAGRGVRGDIDGQDVAVGGPRLIESMNGQVPSVLRESASRWGAEGKTVVYLLIDGQPKAALGLADVIRDASHSAVALLKEMGVRPVMITGDSQDVAKSVAEELEIDEHFAEVLPEHKADRVADLQKEGRKVAMVGDGVNDAPALVTADVGIAIGAGTDVAFESAGIILVRDDPRDVAKVIDLSQSSYRKMLQNLAWATGYNIVALPLAAGILAPVGIVLIPAVGAILMSASTVIVAANAQLLRRLDLADT